MAGEMISGSLLYPDPGKYEIYMSAADENHFEKIATLENDKTYHYEATGLTNGVNYFFTVKALKKGYLPSVSDTVMVMPSVPENKLELDANGNVPMEFATMANGNQVLAYMNEAFPITNGNIWGALFAYNFSTQEHKIIDTASIFPDWSPAEMKVVYCSNEHDINKEEGTSLQLVVYDYLNSKPKVLTQSDFFNSNPEFSPDGQWIVFTSDEGHRASFEFWKISVDGSQKTQITNNLTLTFSGNGNVGIGRPSWSANGDYIYFNRVNSHQSPDGIYRISLSDNSIEPVIISRWANICPSVSPDNKQIAFISDRTGAVHIWVFNMETNEYKQITGDNGDYISFTGCKIEWLSQTKLMYGGYSMVKSKEAIFTIEID